MTEPDLDHAFRKRIQQGFATVQKWENEEILRQCREELVPKDEFFAAKSEREAVQILAKHFQTNIMTWVNCPPCDQCKSDSNVQRREIGMKPLDENGQECRVEEVWCDPCGVSSEFPRYNSVKLILQSKRGRCGEYANLFGCLCRSIGLNTRYVLDFTDHVWTEVFLSGEWVHVDSCEGVVGEKSMYEAGWGKRLNYVLAFTTQYAVDVTPCYTAKWNDPDFQARRRTVTSSETAGDAILRGENVKVALNLTEKERGIVDHQLMLERKTLSDAKLRNSWKERVYQHGRISGSHSWKQGRNETGGGDQPTKHSEEAVKFQIEPFYPANERFEIRIRPKSREIWVNGACCSVGLENAISIVVLDESMPGLVLQSQCFTSLGDLSTFICSLPNERIVVMTGKLLDTRNSEDANLVGLATLGNFNVGAVKDLFLFVGQVMRQPDWSQSIIVEESDEDFVISHVDTIEPVDCSLRTLRSSRPSKVQQRLPEEFMPLQTQKMASFSQKHIVMKNYFNKRKDSCHGYSTKQGGPIYLIGADAYPFLPKTDEDWHSFISFPKVFVPDSDQGIEERKKDTLNFEVPVDASKFDHLGSYILLNPHDGVATAEALQNCRLVGLYFSAHWCGPCRSFTPMLSEMYEVIKEEFPTHGLEIVFVSGDRDQAEFEQYFGTMPWLAVAGFQNQMLSAQYQVQGIPSLVILDAVSGQIVVPNTAARREVHEACQRGEESICRMFRGWLDRVPAETKMLLEILETSCEPGNDEANEALIPEEYLVSEDFRQQQATRESLITELVGQGMTHEEASEAASAAVALSMQDDANSTGRKLEPGSLSGLLKIAKQTREPKDAYKLAKMIQSHHEDPSIVVNMLETIQKYLVNCIKAPHSTRFRWIDLSFKLVDSKIARVDGALGLLNALGFSIEIFGDSYMICIPIHRDLSILNHEIKKLLDEYGK